MNAIARVTVRELRRLPRFPVLWCLLGPIPLAGGLLLTGVFHSEVARRLGILPESTQGGAGPVLVK